MFFFFLLLIESILNKLTVNIEHFISLSYDGVSLKERMQTKEENKSNLLIVFLSHLPHSLRYFVVALGCY